MSVESIIKSIDNAAASVEMEGCVIDEQCRKWCYQLIRNEITMADYIALVKARAGVGA